MRAVFYPYIDSKGRLTDLIEIRVCSATKHPSPYGIPSRTFARTQMTDPKKIKSRKDRRRILAWCLRECRIYYQQIAKRTL